MKEIITKLLHEKAINFKLKFEETKAYNRWINSAEYKKYSTQLSMEELESIFPNKSQFNKDYELEYNENGDPLNQYEFSPDENDIKLEDLKYFGWLNDKNKRDALVSQSFYRDYVRREIGDMPEEVKSNIELHALHILGRCNNPYDWETTSNQINKHKNWFIKKEGENQIYWKNKQGLVYGMVQSGKTASMIALMGLANSAGFNLFIVLSGDKTSLRNQTQKRINQAFNLGSNGSPRNPGSNVISITRDDYDYNEARGNKNNGLDVFKDYLDDKRTIIICIKKNTSNLKKLFKDLRDVRKNQYMIPGFDYSTDLKTMIIDDEADYASQNTKKIGYDPSTINDDITNFRKELSQNTYIAYTATPQACLGADPNALVGYPKDFIWLLDPYRDENGNTTSYLGLQEFFNDYERDLINVVKNEAWPHWEKEEGTKVGVYDIHGEIVESQLKEEELRAIKHFIADKNYRDSKCIDYKNAIIDFIITCAIRWRRHYIKLKEGHFSSELPTLGDIELIDVNDGLTTKGFKSFPYHAMMFNLAYIQNIQSQLIKLIDVLYNEIKFDYENTKSSNWEQDTLFSKQYKKQLAKSNRFEMPPLADAKTLEYFMDIALKISGKTIVGDDKYMYILNSSDEGLTLQYNTSDKDSRPKKASIIIGGLILGRGLTIENLSTSVFIRSQSQSLGDTNLQMCRWFGHKKNDIDLQSVYMQEHSKDLFDNIAYADKDLRDQFWKYIFKNAPAECILLQLQNSPLFKVTSPSKSQFLSKSDKTSYSGKTVNLEQPIKHINYLKNNKILNNFINDMGGGVVMNKRALVFYNVGMDKFKSFFRSFKVHEDALFVTPKLYEAYLEEWLNVNERLPKINIAIFGHNEYLNRRRHGNTFHGFRGGKSQGKYLGDHFVDKESVFHVANYSKRGLKRNELESILVMFYKFNPRYIDKSTSKEEIQRGLNEEPIVSYAISTPLGGPQYKVYVNSGVRIQRLVNEKFCLEWEEKDNTYEE